MTTADSAAADVLAADLLDMTIARIGPPDAAARARAKSRLDQLTMPPWALGRLMDLAVDLAGTTGSERPLVARKTVVVMAGDHGVCSEGVSAYPAEVTPQMIGNFVAGGAGINALAAISNARVVVADLGVAADLSAFGGAILHRKIAWGTANLAVGPAMTQNQARRAITSGIAIANELAATTDVFATGDMGIGNTTPSTCIAAVLTGESVELLTGRGTGIDDAALANKRAVIARALALHRCVATDGLGLLAAMGGFEIGAIAGLCLGAVAQGKIVVVDGFISTAGALIAQALCPAVAAHLVLAHRSQEPGHRAMARTLAREPLLDLGFRLGEGTGAAMALPLIDGAAALLTRVATFAEAAVSAKA